MHRKSLVGILALSLVLAFVGQMRAQQKTPAEIEALKKQDEALFSRTESVIYGEKSGVSLTLDIFKPREKSNGRGIIFVVSGGWVSSRPMMMGFLPREFVRRGYTVFAVVMGSQPKFTIPELVEDLDRGVRFVRYHAKGYGVDPEKLGIYGASAGGHLSLMIGTAGRAGDPKAADPVDRVSSRVAAVACFFPPTDFLNYGQEGQEALGNGILANFAAPFDFQEYSKETKRFERITDASKRREIGRAISPINHVSSDDPPTLIVHGDKDTLVPYQQAQIMVEKLKQAGVPVELVTQPGAAHGWPNWGEEIKPHADWFDKHLK